MIKEGSWVLYKKGSNFEIGVVKSFREDGTPFVYYTEGDTASATPMNLLCEIDNEYAIPSLIKRCK